MAELTSEGEIRLTRYNKFRVSMSRKHRSQVEQEGFYENKKQIYAQSQIKQRQKQSTIGKAKYPEDQRFKKALWKIGALQKQEMRLTFQPKESQYKQFRTQRQRKLRDQFLGRSLNEIQCTFKNPQNEQQIDEAVLDCWKYGQKSNRQSIWKQYKQNLQGLNFDTLRITKKRRQFY